MFAEKIKFKKNMYSGELLGEIKEYAEYLTEADLPKPVICKNEIFTKIKEGNTHAVYSKKGNEFYLTETRYTKYLSNKLFEEV